MARAPLPRYQLYLHPTSSKSWYRRGVCKIESRSGRPSSPREAQDIDSPPIESDAKRPNLFGRHSTSRTSRIRHNGRFVQSPLAVEGQAQHRVEDCSVASQSVSPPFYSNHRLIDMVADASQNRARIGRRLPPGGSHYEPLAVFDSRAAGSAQVKFRIRRARGRGCLGWPRRRRSGRRRRCPRA